MDERSESIPALGPVLIRKGLMTMKEKIERYYGLVANRENETQAQLEERLNLHLEIRDYYLIPRDRVTFKVEEGAYPHYGYALYSEEGMLLYVGIATKPRERWRQHITEKAVDHMDVVAGGTKQQMVAWERFNIEHSIPPLNTMLYRDGKQLTFWDLLEEASKYYEEVLP